METLERGKKSPEVKPSLSLLSAVDEQTLTWRRDWMVFLLPGLVLHISLPLAPTSTPSPGCQPILMILCTFTAPCCHGPAGPTAIPVPHSSPALPPLAGNHLHQLCILRLSGCQHGEGHPPLTFTLYFCFLFGSLRENFNCLRIPYQPQWFYSWFPVNPQPDVMFTNLQDDKPLKSVNLPWRITQEAL